MIVRCIGHSLSQISPGAIESFNHHMHVDAVELVVGQEYVVFGVLFRDGLPWFLVRETTLDSYPRPHFGEFFELVDARIPPDWSLSTGPSNVGSAALLPTPWARDPRFLEKLVDEDQDAITQFRQLGSALAAWHRGEATPQLTR